MAEKKRYYWLKLQHDFFQSKRIKKLRKLAGGDTYTIIYLKMQLKAILNNGVLTYTGIEPTFSEELALDIDEEPENVAVTVNYLLNCGLLETADGTDYLVPYAVSNTGSETAVAQRVRNYRERQKVLHGNDDVTQTKRLSNGMEQNGNGEKEIDTEIEKDTEEDVVEARAETDLGQIMTYYMENISMGAPSGVVTAAIQSYAEELSPDVVLHAIQQAAERDVHTWTYIKAILDRYKASGLTTLEAVEMDERRTRSARDGEKPVHGLSGSTEDKINGSTGRYDFIRADNE